MHVNEKECEAAGLDPAVVERLARRMARVMRDADAIGLIAFGGGCSLNFRFDDGHDRKLIVAEGMGQNCDGGDGAAAEDDAGLLRGE